MYRTIRYATLVNELYDNSDDELQTEQWVLSKSKKLVGGIDR